MSVEESTTPTSEQEHPTNKKNEDCDDLKVSNNQKKMMKLGNASLDFSFHEAARHELQDSILMEDSFAIDDGYSSKTAMNHASTTMNYKSKDAVMRAKDK